MQVMITMIQIITIVWNTRGYSNRLTALMLWRKRTFYIKNAMPGTFLRYRNVKLSQMSFIPKYQRVYDITQNVTIMKIYHWTPQAKSGNKWKRITEQTKTQQL